MFVLLLVDDELRERRLLENLIKDMCPNVTVVGFGNGFEVMDYIMKNDADILITDIKMPNMSGIELIEKIIEKNYSIKTVILSGFSDFEYAKKAIRYGVKDYLTKPVDDVELKNTLDRICNELADEIEEKQQKSTELNIRFLENLCLGIYEDNKNLEKGFEEAEFPFSLANSKGLVLNVYINRIHIDDEEYEYSIKQILTSILGSYIYCVFSKNNLFTYFVFFQSEIDESELKQKLMTLTECISNAEIVSRFKILSELNNKNIFSAKNKFELFISKLISNDNAINKKISQIIIDECLKNKFDIKSINNVVYGLLDKEKIRIIQEFSEKSGIDIFQKSIDIMEIVEQYIEENFNKNITRSDVANAVGMNSSYFSRYFKQRKNMTFHEYLAGYRIDIAKKMLATKKTIEEITTATGFQDTRTFRRNFIMVVGMSPAEYRKELGMNYYGKV